MIYKCAPCFYSSKNKSDFEKHLKTNKHILSVLHDTKVRQIAKNDKIKSDYDTDILEFSGNEQPKSSRKAPIYEPKKCDFCESKFSKQSNLTRHLKTCPSKMEKIQQDQVKMQQDMINLLKQQVTKLSNIAEKSTAAAEHSSSASASSASTLNLLAKYCNKAQETLPFTDMKLLTGDDKTLLEMAMEYEEMDSFEFYQKAVNVLEKYYKHQDPKLQTLWSSDVSRQNYMIRKKMDDDSVIWVSDKKGKVVGQLLVDPIMKQLDMDVSNFIKECTKKLDDDANDLEELTPYERDELFNKRKVATVVLTKVLNGEFKKDIIKNLANRLCFDKNLVFKPSNEKISEDTDESSETKPNNSNIEEVD